MLQKLATLLAQKRLTQVLLVVHALVALVLCWFMRNFTAGDQDTYLNLARSILEGKYSFWYWLEPWPADTFRTPGYPLFLAPLVALWDNVWLVRLAQWALFLVTLVLTIGILQHSLRRIWPQAPQRERLSINLFLLLLLTQPQMPYLVSLVFPEILVCTLLTTWVWLKMRHGQAESAQRWHWAAEGLVLGLCALVRPVMLLFPLAWLVAELIWRPSGQLRLKHNGLVIAVFLLTLLPYGFWNLHHHDEFRFTGLEGPQPNLHLGLWQHKLPNTYTHRYWPFTHMGYEHAAIWLGLTNPADTTELLKEYHAEFDRIDAQLKPLMTHTDSAVYDSFYFHQTLFCTFNTELTKKRRELVGEAYWSHVQAEPGWYLATRLYNAFRIWVTGPDNLVLEEGLGWAVGLLYLLTLVTFLVLLFGVLTPLGLMFAGRFPWKALLPVWVMLLYFWLIHTPFAIQSRYTAPVRPLAVLLWALWLTPHLSRWVGQEKENVTE